MSYVRYFSLLPTAFWSVLVLCHLGTTAKSPDTCGDFFFLPMLSNCELFLEAVPCSNKSKILVSMATRAGELVHNFSVSFGNITEVTLRAINKGKHEGLVVRSTDDISVYIHKTVGDSMIVFPVDSFGRQYRVFSPSAYSHTDVKTSPNEHKRGSSSQSIFLYIFSPSNKTRIKLTPLPLSHSSSLNTHDLLSNPPSSPNSLHPSTVSPTKLSIPIASSKSSLPIATESPSTISAKALTESAALSLSSILSSSSSYFSDRNSSPSSTDSNVSPLSPSLSSPLTSAPSSSSTMLSSTILLDAFELHIVHIDLRKGYLLQSSDPFSVLLVQTNTSLTHSSALCLDADLTYIDFVPPVSVRGRHFYLAFPNLTDFSIFISGKKDDVVDVTTDTRSLEIKLNQIGLNVTKVVGTSSAWISSESSVIVYVTITICSNDTCAENGFYLPSVDHYFSCHGYTSNMGYCSCTCPSVFERDITPSKFSYLQNTSTIRSAPTFYPLLVEDLFDVSTTISKAPHLNHVEDIIITTNNSFMIFRHDLENLNYLPAGSMLVDIYRDCDQDSSLGEGCREDTRLDSPSKSKASVEKRPSSNVYFTEQSSFGEAGKTGTCSCDFIKDVDTLFLLKNTAGDIDPLVVGRAVVNVKLSGHEGEIINWPEDIVDTTRPLIAVVVSLSVAILAVLALITAYMLIEIMSRRRQIRNTKIRPFVS